MEMGRILTQEDFDRIKRLKHRRLVEATMEKHGIKSKRKMENLRQKAEEDAENTLEFLVRITPRPPLVDSPDLLRKTSPDFS